MRSLFVSTERCCFGKSASLRMTSVAALLSGVALTSSLAVAAEPVVSSDEPQSTSVTQSTTTTTVTTNTPSVTVAPLPPPPMVSATVVTPLPAAPQPIAPTVIAPVQVAPQPQPFVGNPVQGPIYFNGPVWIIPAQPVKRWCSPHCRSSFRRRRCLCSRRSCIRRRWFVRFARCRSFVVRWWRVRRRVVRCSGWAFATSYGIRSQEVFGENRR